jgi:hypothetical protein
MQKNPEIPLNLFQVLEEEYLNLHGPLDEEDVIQLPISSAGMKSYRRVKARRDWLLHRGHIKYPLSLILKLLSPVERARLVGTADANATSTPNTPDAPDASAKPSATQAVAPVKSETGKKPLPSPAQNGLVAHLRETFTFDDLKKIYDAVAPFAGKLDSLFDDPLQMPKERLQLEQDVREEKRRQAACDALKELENKLNVILKDAKNQLYTTARFRQITLSDKTRLLIQEGTTLNPFNDIIRFTGDDLIQFKRLLLEDAFPEEIEKISNIRLAAVNRYLHDAGQAALSLSGGGIRSGTFALGLIQGLARRGLLEQFQYLSTVSGGGYMGGWLTAWVHRHRDGLAGVTNDLRNTPPDTKIDPDPEPLRYLRRYSNFITPKVGLLTADTWTFIGIYLRNLFLNWTVIIPFLLGWLMLPRLYNSALLAWFPESESALGGFTLFCYPFEGRYFPLAVGCLLAVIAIAYVSFNRPYVREQLRVRSPFWYGQTGQRSFLRLCCLPLTLAAVLITIYWAWSREAHELAGDPSRPIWPYILFGAGLCAVGWLTAMCVLRRLPWAAPLLALTVGAWLLLRCNLAGIWELAPFAFFAAFALAELLLVKRVTRRPKYAHWGELSFYELGALAGAGAVGGVVFWLAEKIPSPIKPYINTAWTSWTTEVYTCLAVPVFLGGFLLSMTIFIGLTSHSKKFTDEDREWWARASAWIFIVVISWVVFSSLVLFGPLALLYSPTIIASAGGLSGLVALLTGRSSKTPAAEQGKAEGSRLSSFMGSILPLLAMIFLAVFAALLSLLTSWIIVGLMYALTPATKFMIALYGLTNPFVHMWAVHYPSVGLMFFVMLGFLILGYVMARLINLNRFSLHAGYRDRLIRGFLGASRDEGTRKPNPFTGFDPLDDLRMHELRPMLFQEGDFINIGQLADRLRRHADDDAVSKYLWDQDILHDDTKDELEAYSTDALPSQSLKAALIRDLNGALEDLEHPLYDAAPFKPLREQEPAIGIIKWAQQQEPDQLEQYRRSPYAILLNRVLLQFAYPEEIRKKYPPPHRGMHVINTTLNLVGGDNLAWQQRKAEPFSVSPLHSGCFRLGYRRSRFFGDEDGIALGTAVAISGAAASSNMGYYTTSPALSMVLTLFNVRLGWWLGNPGSAGESTYTRQSPKLSVQPIIAEAFGLTDDRSKYVYLTDGGHFENLALYEMVLRRCRLVILSDAAADEDYEFNDLGNAVRKIRIDLGVPIEFEDFPIFRKSLNGQKDDDDNRRGSYWAVGRIRYSCVDTVWDEKEKKFVPAPDGMLIYVKPSVYGEEPQDVLHYKRSHKSFPHETTADQFFDEPQFESYRALSFYIMGRMCGDDDAKVKTLEALAGKLYWQEDATEKLKRTWPTIDAAWLKTLEPSRQPKP